MVLSPGKFANPMENGGPPLDRRRFLLSAAALLPPPDKKPAVAAIVTEYRYYSHADVIAGRILEGYAPDGIRQEPRTRIVCLRSGPVEMAPISTPACCSRNRR